MDNGQFEKALPLLERSLSIKRQNLPREHLDLANGEIACILLCWMEFMSNSRRNELISDGRFGLFVLSYQTVVLVL